MARAMAKPPMKTTKKGKATRKTNMGRSQRMGRHG